LTARITGAYPTDRDVLPEQWQDNQVTEIGGEGTVRLPTERDGSYFVFTGAVASGLTRPRLGSETVKGYVRVEGSASRLQFLDPGLTLGLRVYGGAQSRAPLQRALFASTVDPFTSFWNPWFRPHDAVLKQEGINAIPLGGAGLRGYSYALALSRVAAANGELARRLWTFGNSSSGRRSVWVAAFGDVAAASSDFATFGGSLLLDAGVGAALRGRLWDRDVRFRLDFPLFVKQPDLASGPSFARKGSIGFRYVVSLGELW
jgi:hypothetical protein